MDFLAEVQKRAAAHVDLEIIDVEPLRFKAPEKVDKGKAVAMGTLKRKGSGACGPREKLMKDAISARIGSGGEEEQAGEAGRFAPAWKLGREMNLGTVIERREWATYALPPQVGVNFSKRTDQEVEARANAAVVELTMDVKAEARSNEELKKRLKESQKREEVTDVALKAADVENRRLVLRNEVLSDSREELQRRLAQVVDVRNFWATEGAGPVVRTCLKSPEVYEWLLNFASVMMSVGYSNGVRAVYLTHLKDRDPNEFKDFGKGDVDAGEQIKRRVERFRSGQMPFEFLEYLAANPGLAVEELREMETAAYRRLDGSYGRVVEAAQGVAGETLEVPRLPESPPTIGVEVGEASEPEQRPDSADATEAEVLMKEAEMLTGGSWDPENTQGFGMPM